MKKSVFIMIVTAIAFEGYAQKMAVKMYADRTARAVGDLVTVVIEEQSSSAQDATNDKSKSASAAAAASIPSPTVGGDAVWKSLALPEWSMEGNKAYNAAASKAASDSLSASVTVFITELLPNGNMVIRGDRVVNIDGDLIKFTLTGMIRPDDISTGNQILSTRIAGASITYKAIGEITDNNKPGMIARLIDWVVPF